MSRNIRIEIPMVWEYVHKVRAEVKAALTSYPEELSSAAVMVASELVENAIKYGSAVPALGWARFDFAIVENYIQIQVANGITDPAALALVELRIKELQAPGRRDRLYISRLKKLTKHSPQPNQLGLYRVGYEGHFDLDYTYADQVLTMTARRRASS